MTADPVDSAHSQLPLVHAIGELRAALHRGYGFPGDADVFEADLAHEIEHADPATCPALSASWRSSGVG
ncbi:hypothetical protein ABZ400_11795 [Streptomyces sp. NPDC005897]|uniref:hypothetical protein n=1 Tax=Streptomyces sp. NPDC005897 TaxID=3157081 RepID=UPI0033C15A86